MHIAEVERRKGGRVYRTWLLRRSYRDERGRSQKETLANLSSLPESAIAVLDAHLKGRAMVPAGEALEIVRTRSHGAVQAVKAAFDRLGIPGLLASRRSPRRDAACAMIAARIIRPHTKLGTTRWWRGTTLPETFGVAEAGENELYAAMDWLLARQPRIEARLARRHLAEGGLVLLDLSSSWLEGTTCPLARFGHSRDGKRGKMQVNWGLMCDVRGCPVSVTVLPGNVGDSETLLPAVERLRRRFGIRRVAVVGDRGMVVQAGIDGLRRMGGIDWITALRSGAVRRLARKGAIDPLDEAGLFELVHPDFPRRAPGRLPQPPPGGAEGANPGGPAPGHRGRSRRGPPARRGRAAQGGRRDRHARRRGGQPVQGEEALRLPDRRAQPLVPAEGGIHRARGGARRHLRDPDLASRGGHGGGGLRPELQGADPRGAGVPHNQDGGPARPADPPPDR